MYLWMWCLEKLRNALTVFQYQGNQCPFKYCKLNQAYGWFSGCILYNVPLEILRLYRDITIFDEGLEKDQYIWELVKKSVSKIKILFIVWSQCVLQRFKSCMKKIPMFKITYLRSYTLSFRFGVLFDWD